jgi:hypothetical protein
MQIKITRSIATWNIMYVSNSGRSDVIANFSDAGLQRALVCETAIQAADLKGCDEIILDMTQEEAEQLRLFNRNARMEDVLAQFIALWKEAV